MSLRRFMPDSQLVCLVIALCLVILWSWLRDRGGDDRPVAPETEVVACPYPVWPEPTEDPEKIEDRLALLKGAMEDCAKRMGRELPPEAPKPALPAPVWRAIKS